MYKEILLPIDMMEESSWKHSLPVALGFAKSFKSNLHIMTVIPDSGMAIVNQYFSKSIANEITDQTKKNLQKFVKDNVPKSIKVNSIVHTGNVYESIIDAATKINADLIIMTAGRPELKDYLLGPNAARVVRHSDRSVLVVRKR